MQVIGVIGGISPHSTVYYYEALNAAAREELGARHSAPCLIHSVDFGVIEQLHAAKDWAGVTQELVDAARSLERGGARVIVLACNTLHKVADHIAAAVRVPFLHIGDAVADAIEAHQVERGTLRRVGLLGTRFTMEAGFLRKRLEDRGLEVAVPDRDARNRLHRIIDEELCDGVIRRESRAALVESVDQLAEAHGIDAVVLGCTELGLLLGTHALVVPAFDSARIHALAAVNAARSRAPDA